MLPVRRPTDRLNTGSGVFVRDTSRQGYTLSLGIRTGRMVGNVRGNLRVAAENERLRR